MTVENRSFPEQATFPISFTIVGGEVSGLLAAFALRRVGHHVTVLEKADSIDSRPRFGSLIPPNLSKIIYHWGLKDEFEKISHKSIAIRIARLESGEILGDHVWDDEILKETRGEWRFSRQSEMIDFLYHYAVKLGATIRFGTEVTSVDPQAASVTLSSGEVVEGDVIIGADGASGITRKYILKEENVEDDSAPLQKMYTTIIPRRKIECDPSLQSLYGQPWPSLLSWHGEGRFAYAFPVAGTSDLAMFVYDAPDVTESSWDKLAPLKGFQESLSSCEPRLQKLGRLATSASCVSWRNYAQLEDWVHCDGRMILIGEAAHPLPIGAVQSAAMAFEDGAVLAKLFSHCNEKAQISGFLYAFQDLRQPRLETIHQSELAFQALSTLLAGEAQEMRDSTMKDKHARGIGILEGDGDDDSESPEWREAKEVFGYDAEDESDGWWVEWGMLRERAKAIANE